MALLCRCIILDTKHHNKPHIHVSYQGESASIEIPTGLVLDGSIPSNKLKLVRAWIVIHHEDLMADWQLASNGEPVFRIDPLK